MNQYNLIFDLWLTRWSNRCWGALAIIRISVGNSLSLIDWNNNFQKKKTVNESRMENDYHLIDRQLVSYKQKHSLSLKRSCFFHLRDIKYPFHLFFDPHLIIQNLFLMASDVSLRRIYRYSMVSSSLMNKMMTYKLFLRRRSLFAK